MGRLEVLRRLAVGLGLVRDLLVGTLLVLALLRSVGGLVAQVLVLVLP